MKKEENAEKDYSNENMILIVDEDGLVKEIKHKEDEEP